MSYLARNNLKGSQSSTERCVSSNVQASICKKCTFALRKKISKALSIAPSVRNSTSARACAFPYLSTAMITIGWRADSPPPLCPHCAQLSCLSQLGMSCCSGAHQCWASQCCYRRQRIPRLPEVCSSSLRGTQHLCRGSAPAFHRCHWTTNQDGSPP